MSPNTDQVTFALLLTVSLLFVGTPARALPDDVQVEEPVATFDVKSVNEAGMLGIELMPDTSEG